MQRQWYQKKGVKGDHDKKRHRTPKDDTRHTDDQLTSLVQEPGIQ
jgi:hypothetical protein